MDLELENDLRAAAFRWLDDQISRHGDVLDGALLRLGFDFRGRRVPLAVQQGIHKPKFVEAALSLRSAHDSPYDDCFSGEETLVYRYRGRDPSAWDNRAARLAFRHQLPLVYLHAVSGDPPKYAVVHPAYVVEDRPSELAFHVRVEPAGARVLADGVSLARDADAGAADREIRRRYATRLVKSRLHQATFRERVLAAYRQQCAMCRLRHPKLLEAAHIVPDSDAAGEPVVSNGLSLCRIHHGAFDVHYVGVEPTTHMIRVRPSLLEEEDGPMLRHGLQALEGERISLPRRGVDQPDPERLRRSWEAFQAAG